LSTRNLTELRILANPVYVPDDPNGRASVEVYRRFFLAGILSVLTAGCTLGAVALFGIALRGNYLASSWTPYVLAHANSQLYGWVGFFVMGFALQQHPPRNSRKALFEKVAWWALGLMAVGVGLRFAAEPLVSVDRSLWLPVGILSCVLQIAAVALFIANIALTRYRTGEGLTWQTKFVFASLAWLAAVAIAEPFYFALSHQSERMASIAFVAEWFPPYREAQFLGFVTMMIFGVAFVKMNSCFGAGKASQHKGNLGFALWSLGLSMRMIGWIVYFRSGLEGSAGWIYFGGGVALAIAAAVLVGATRMFEPLDARLHAHKFVRGALAWLLIAGILLILEPFHLAAIGQPFSHAYTGAVRHAVTVGFISQMILGVGMHVIGRMNDLTPAQEKPLWTAFVLLNLGNTLRVILEIGTDYSRSAFLPMGVTGFIELVALLIWASAVVPPMLSSLRPRSPHHA